MEKPAETDFPIHELIKRRWSPLAFSGEPIEEEKLCALFEAARWAPSSFNDQPWHFIVGTRDGHPETYQALYDALVEGNQRWADTAPVLALSVARTHFKHNGNENRHALHDVGLAVENLVIEAISRGLFVHQMAGYSEEDVRTVFEIPEDHQPVAALAIGYPGDPGDLPESLRERENAERSRKPLEEFVFSGRWDEPASLNGIDGD